MTTDLHSNPPQSPGDPNNLLALHHNQGDNMTTATYVSPSSAHRWLNCSGSVQLQALYPTPPKTTEAAHYGSRVHDIAQTFLIHDNPHYYYQAHKQQFPQQLQEIEEAWAFYQYVKSQQKPNHTLLVEQKQSLDIFCPTMKGTPDIVLYSPEDLHIIDLKTGGTLVSAHNNPQLMMYALAIMHNYQLTPETVHLHIYQNNPRSGNNTHYYSPPLQHLQLFKKAVMSSLSFINRGYFIYSVGDHCTYCPAQPHCPVYSQYLYNKYTALTKSNYHEVTISSMPLEKRATIYSLLRSLEPLKETLAASLLEENPQDLQTHGLQVKTRRLPSKYQDEQQALETLLDSGADIDTIAPRSLESPSKLKKINQTYYSLVEPYLSPTEDTKYLAQQKTTKTPQIP